MENDELRVIDSRSARRYELQLGEEVVGFIAYHPQNGSLVLVHTEVDPAFEDRGFASRLVAGALENIRTHGLSIVPVCPFVSAYLRRHPEDADIVAGRPAASA